MITWENYEEYMMMHADGELPPEEVHELEKFIAAHPQLQKEMTAFIIARLQPDATVTFDDKQSLIKPASPKTGILLPVWQRYGIAAGIAAILVLTVFKLKDGHNASDIAVVNNRTIAKGTVKPPAGNTNNNASPTKPANGILAVAPSPSPKYISAHKQSKKGRSVEQPVVAHANEKEIIMPVLPAMQILPVSPENGTIQNMSVPEYVFANADGVKRSFLDKLPIDDIKKKELNDIAQSIKGATDGQKFTLRIEKRKLVLSF